MPENAKDKRNAQFNMERKARRLSYQDMMWSMRKAGLNPILAANAHPQQISIDQGMSEGPAHTQAAASATNAATEAYKAPSEASAKTASAAAAQASIASTAADVNLKRLAAPNIPLEGERLVAESGAKRSAAKLDDARAISEAENKGYISEKTARERTERLLNERDLEFGTGVDIKKDPIGYLFGGGEKGVEKLSGYGSSAKDAVLQYIEERAARDREHLRSMRSGRRGR